MWIVEDEGMNKLLDGEFTDVIELKNIDNNMSMRKLFIYQDSYKSYDGFRKFCNNKLYPIIKSIRFIHDDSLFAKVIKRFVK